MEVDNMDMEGVMMDEVEMQINDLEGDNREVQMQMAGMEVEEKMDVEDDMELEGNFELDIDMEMEIDIE
jgi:hypothetical protein